AACPRSSNGPQGNAAMRKASSRLAADAHCVHGPAASFLTRPRNRADNGNVTRPSSQVPEKPALVAAKEIDMCDYSLHHVMSRPAAVGDKLVSTTFPGTITRGFAPAGDPNTAICLLPGTEIAFEDEIRYYEA